MGGAGAEIVVALLLELVAPDSVIEVGGPDEWTDAIVAAGIADVVAVRAPGATGVTPGAHLVVHDLRGPLTLDRRFALAVSPHVGAEVPLEGIDAFVGSLCQLAPVVAFAAVDPGLAAPGTPNARSALWWDSAFERHGYTAHDIVRPRVWDDERVALAVRQSLVLYAPSGTVASGPPLTAAAGRTAVHPEAYHYAVASRDARQTAEHDLATAQTVALSAEVTMLAEQISWLEGERARLLGRVHDVALRLAVVAGEPAAALEPGAEPEPRVQEALRHAAWVATEADLTAARALLATPPVRGARRIVRRLSARVTPRLPPVFDQEWYVRRYPDVALSPLSPQWHYRRSGALQGRSPHPFFDVAWYCEQTPGVAPRDAVAHFLAAGWKEGRDPHPLFDVDWYAGVTGDVAAGENPFLHWLRIGRAEGRSPSPLFDPEFYAKAGPDLAGEEPLRHFLATGWKEGRDPHQWFDVDWYLAAHPDVAAAGLNPLVDYLAQGGRRGWDPHPLFDTAWYVSQHPDAAAGGAVPLVHFVLRGAAAASRPSRGPAVRPDA